MISLASKKQVDELYIMRAFAILAVVLIHATSKPLTELDTTSTSFFVYKIFNTLAAFAVPAFIFMSGFVLVYNYVSKPLNRENLLTFYKKRILHIIVPYLFFSVFYFVFIHVFMYGERNVPALTERFFRDFFIQGRTFYHLYFMYVIVQFYLIFPLVWGLFRHPRLARHSLWIGFAIQVGFILANGQLHLFPKKSIVFLTYFFYYCFGAWLSVHYEKLEDWLHTAKSVFYRIVMYAAWLAVACWYAFVYYYGQRGIYHADQKVYELAFLLYCSLSSVVLLNVSSWLYKRASKYLVNLLVHLGALSFAVYFIHPFFQIFYRKIQASSNLLWYHVYIVGGFAAVLAASWISTHFIVKNMKFSWPFLGSVPKRLPYKL